MGIKDTWAVKQLVMATQQLHATRLYERFANNDFFLIHTPRLDEPVVAILMGNGGETYGLNLFLGATAQASCDAMFASHSESQARMAMMQAHLLRYSMVEGMELSFEVRKWMKKAKVKPDRRRLYPDPIHIEPGMVPTIALKDKQTRLLLHLTRGILAAAEDKAFRPCGRDRRGRTLAVTLTREIENPRATIAWEQTEPDATATPDRPTALTSGLFDDGAAQVPYDLSGLQPSGDNWLVSMMPAPGYVQDDDRQPFMLLVCSEQTEGLWPCLIMGAQGQTVVDELAALMRGEPELPQDGSGMPDPGLSDLTPPPPGLPASLLADSAALHSVLSPAFSPLGIDCHGGGDDPALQAIFEQFKGTFDDSLDGGDFDDLLIEHLGDRPDDDDIDGWKRVDGYLKDLIHAGFEDNPKFRGTRALNRYFGPDADALQLMIDYRQMMAIDSYALWFATSYRSTRKQPTLAQAWLDDPATPRPARHLLQAILDQAPNIYRLGEADIDTGKIEYQDIFTGELTIVTDYNLSTCVEPGMILPGLLVPAGDFHFFYPAGPLMTGWQLNAALDYFDAQRITAHPAKAFREQPHLLGRLWDIIDQAGRHKPDLRNTDGHALALHTAVFACPDRRAVERFLEQNDSYQPEDQDTWNWFRQGTPTPNFKPTDTSQTRVCDTSQETNHGPITLLGQVKLGNGKLTLTVNSQERMAAAKALLELIDGVVLHSIESKTADALFDQAQHDQAHPIDSFDPTDDPDDNTSDHFDEDQARATSAYIAEYYLQWLDSPIPMLNNLTPHQAAQDPELRDKVAAMIRSIPDPTDRGNSNLQIAAPREQLLRELGLS